MLYISLKAKSGNSRVMPVKEMVQAIFEPVSKNLDALSGVVDSKKTD